MGVVQVIESEKPSASLSVDGTREFRRTMTVLLSSVHDGPLVAIQGCPAANSIYEFGGGSEMFPAYLRDYEPEPIGPKAYRVGLVYRSVQKTEEDEPEDPELNPEFELPEVSVGTALGQRELLKDIDDNPIVNSAKEFFSSFPSVDHPSRRIQITRNEPISYNYVAIDDLLLTVNEDPIWGYAAGRVRFSDHNMTLTMRTTPNGLYWVFWRVSYGFDVKLGIEKDWKIRLLNYGPTYWAGGERKQFLTKDGYPINWFLTEAGGPQDMDPDQVEPTFEEFEAYESAAWSVMNLPTDLRNCRPRLVSI